jgi:DNA-binding LacI/PurR family transcriptional regulator
VFELASELQSSSNSAARALVSSKTYAVGFVIKRVLIGSENPFYDRIMLGVEQELELVYDYGERQPERDDRTLRDLLLRCKDCGICVE